MKAVFVADAHLKGPGDSNQDLFCRFLESIKGVDRLYILGDIFEFWAGDDPFLRGRYAPVLDRLVQLREDGAEIVYSEGNHDFSLGPFFSSTIGADVYPESAESELDDLRLFITHGDIVDMSVSYRLWRWFLRSPLFALIYAGIPSACAWRIAMALSRRSRRSMEHGLMLDGMMKGYARKRIGDGFDVVVMAHSHVASISKEVGGNRVGIYANPGDWVNHRSYLLFEGGEFNIERFTV